MRVSRVRGFDWLTGAIGLVLLVVLSLTWFETPGLLLSAWDAFAITDLVLALAALLAVALPRVTAAARAPAVPVALGVLTRAWTVIGVPLTLLALLSQPGANEETAIRPGGWLGLAVVAALLWSSYRSLRDERTPGIAPPSFPVMAAPPPGAGPEPTAPPTVAT